MWLFVCEKHLITTFYLLITPKGTAFQQMRLNDAMITAIMFKILFKSHDQLLLKMPFYLMTQHYFFCIIMHFLPQ